MPCDASALKECNGRKLEDMMKRRREVCAEFVSKPAATTADATGEHSDAQEVPRSTETCRRMQTSDSQLQELLTERRNRCQVLESSPLPHLANALWNQDVSKTKGYHQEFLERPGEESCADFKWEAVKMEVREREKRAPPKGEERVKEMDEKAREPARNEEAKAQQEEQARQVVEDKVCQAEVQAEPARQEAEQVKGQPSDSGQQQQQQHLTGFHFDKDELLALIPTLMRYHCPALPASDATLQLARLDLQSATPRSLRASRCAAVGADEVLQHVYERPTVPWRLVVVDVRRSASYGLPVCVRLPGASLEELLALPEDDDIHFCLMDDGDVSELYEAWSRMRCHVSTVDGGWPCVEGLVQALGLELLPLEVPKFSSTRTSWGQEELLDV